MSRDLQKGMTGGYLNHVILSRAEHVDEVEQILRDTNNGGGFNNSFARNTSTIVSVFDRWGNAAVFEIDGDSFTRDNVTQEYQVGAQVHNDDKDLPNPANGNYSGYDWCTNFSKVQWIKANGFPYFVDSQETIVDGNGNVVNVGSSPDRIQNWRSVCGEIDDDVGSVRRTDGERFCPDLSLHEYLADLRTGTHSESQLKADMRSWQTSLARKTVDYYIGEKKPYHVIDNVDATASFGWGNSVTRPDYY